MDHDLVVRQKVMEKYLLQELDDEQRDEFEEHFFECRECALDVRAGAEFIEQSQDALGEDKGRMEAVKPIPAPVKPDWFAWLRPRYAMSAVAILLAVIAYQNLNGFRSGGSEKGLQLLPSASINLATRAGAATAVHAKRGEPFLLLVNIPGESRLSSYVAEFYGPAGNVKGSVAISAEAVNDTVPVRIPGQQEAGVYTLVVRGLVQGDGSAAEIGRQPFELRLE
jgi:hypothetical protein